MYKIKRIRNYFGTSNGIPTVVFSLTNNFPHDLFEVEEIALDQIAGPCFVDDKVLSDYLDYMCENGIVYVRRFKFIETIKDDVAFYITKNGRIKIYNRVYGTRIYRRIDSDILQ